MHVLHRYIELDLHCASTDHSGYFATLGLEKKFARRDILRRLARQHAQEIREVGATNGRKHMDVAGVAAWLCWHISHSVATNNISTQEVS